METKQKMVNAALACFFAGGLNAVAFANETANNAAPAAGATEAKVKCYGVNECATKGACGGKGRSCKGTNTCKGKGFLEMSAAECHEKGGSTTEGAGKHMMMKKRAPHHRENEPKTHPHHREHKRMKHEHHNRPHTAPAAAPAPAVPATTPAAPAATTPAAPAGN